VYDDETGFYYLRSRYYNPRWGRFVNADSVLNCDSFVGLNCFQYCSGNPITGHDPSGHALERSAGIGGGGGGGAIVFPLWLWLTNCYSKLVNGDSRTHTSTFTKSPTVSNSVPSKLEGIASKYRNFECHLAVEEMSDYLKKLGRSIRSP